MNPSIRRPVLFGLLTLSAAAVAWDRWHQDTSIPAAVSEATPRRAPAASAVSASGALSSRAASASVGPILAIQGREAYQQTGSDVFPSVTPALPPAAPPAVVETPKPTAPALPFTVIGKKQDGDQWEIFLARGDQTWVASVGSQLGADYRVAAINATQMTLVYLPLQETQTLPIGAAFND